MNQTKKPATLPGKILYWMLRRFRAQATEMGIQAEEVIQEAKKESSGQAHQFPQKSRGDTYENNQ